MTILTAGGIRFAAAGVPPRDAAPTVSRPSAIPTTIDDLELSVAQQVPAFGGMFLDGSGRLNIELTDAAQLVAAESAIEAVFGRGRFDLANARAVKARYTFAQLKGWHDRHRLTTLAVGGVVSTGIRKSSNRLRVVVANADAASAVQSVLARYEIPSDAVELVTEKGFDFYDGLLDNHRPLLGGLAISTGKGGGCTLSYLAVLFGKAGFVTCSHCTDVQGGVEGTVIHQPSVSGDLNRIGLELVDPDFFTDDCPSGRQCRFSDTAFIARDGGSDPLTHRAAGKLGRIAFVDGAKQIVTELQIAGQLTPIDGDFVTKIGMTTGLTAGNVTDTCMDINVNKSNKTLFCQFAVEGLSDSGDSGSPVFLVIPQIAANVEATTVSLVGTLWGGTTGFFGFSPMTSIQAELGPLRTSLGEFGLNSAPEVKIVQPQNQAAVGVSGLNFVDFKAEIVDYEGCCQSIVWQSDRDGAMGNGANLEFTFQTSGTRTVTVTATDDDGGVTSDSIQVTAGTVPPSVTIVKPAAAQTLHTGLPYVLEGTSFDPNEPYLAIACASLTWKSSKAGDPFPVIGCDPQVTFQTVGSRVLTLTGTDSQNLTASASVTINVTKAPQGGPPSVSILTPVDNSFLLATTEVTLQGQVQDPANSGSIAYQWLLVEGPTTTVLASGSVASGGQPILQWTPKSNVPFHCGGETVTLELTATNPSNQTGSATISAWISYPTC